MKYSPLVSEHFHHPRNVGLLPEATVVGEAENPVCLDRLRLFLLMDSATGTVARATFQAEGCVPSMALGSWLTEFLPGKTRDELLSLTGEEVEELVGTLPATKKHAAHLAVEALRDALSKLSPG